MNKIAVVDIGRIFGSPYGTQQQGYGIASLVSLVLYNAIALAGVILFILLLYGGIMVISGAGSGDKENIAKGRKAISSAVMGFLIIFLSYWIIVILENVLGFRITYPMS